MEYLNTENEEVLEKERKMKTLELLQNKLNHVCIHREDLLNAARALLNDVKQLDQEAKTIREMIGLIK